LLGLLGSQRLPLMGNRNLRRLAGALAGALVLLGSILIYLSRTRPPSSPHDDSQAGGAAQSYESKPNRKSAQMRPPRFSAAPAPKFSVREPAIMTVQRQRELGRSPPSFAKLHAAEPRDPVWAAAMETELRKRLKDDFKGLGIESVNVDELDCRTSSCKLIVSWDRSAQAIAEARLANNDDQVKNVLVLLQYATGPLGSFSQEVSPPGPPKPLWAPGVVLPDGRISTGAVILFGEANMDPESYPAWVAKLHAGNQERMKVLKDWTR
jgi:hypothetical protein